MKLHEVPTLLLCQALSKSQQLEESSRVVRQSSSAVLNLSPQFIKSAYAFCNQFNTSKKEKKNSSPFLFMKQRKRESLKTSSKDSTWRVTAVNPCSYDVAVVEFTNRLADHDLIKLFYIKPWTSMKP